MTVHLPVNRAEKAKTPLPSSGECGQVFCNGVYLFFYQFYFQLVLSLFIYLSKLLNIWPQCTGQHGAAWTNFNRQVIKTYLFRATFFQFLLGSVARTLTLTLIPQACPGTTLGSRTSWMCPENLQGEALRRHPDHHHKSDTRSTLLLTPHQSTCSSHTPFCPDWRTCGLLRLGQQLTLNPERAIHSTRHRTTASDFEGLIPAAAHLHANRPSVCSVTV